MSLQNLKRKHQEKPPQQGSSQQSSLAQLVAEQAHLLVPSQLMPASALYNQK